MKQILLSLLCSVPMFCFGQILLYNDGAMVKVQTGATLFVEGGIQNTASGTFDNDGTIELQGNFVNAGTWEPSQPNTLKFSGTGASDVTSGPAVFQTIVDAKVGANVNLIDAMTINTLLDFTSTGATKLSIGSNNLNMGSGAAVNGYDIDEFVLTAGTGKMKKSFTSLTNFVFPVGFTTATYNPATLNVTAGPNDTYGVRVLASPTTGNGLTGTPITTDVVDAVWDINETTIGGNTVDVTLGWQESDELTGFDDNLNTVSFNDGVNGWDGLFANLGPESPTNFRTRTGFTGFGAFGVGDKTLANQIVMAPKVFLQGPYNATTDLMGDALRTSNYITLVEPYTAAPYSYVNVGYGGGESVPNNTVFDQSGTNNDIVDWITVELRDQTTPATKVATRNALLQRDGDIVDLDGSSALIFSGMADGTYHVGIKHRNHLPIRTQNALALTGSSVALNFTVTGYAFDNGSTNNEPTVPVEPGIEAMWGGDADLNNQIAYGTGDRLAVLNKVGASTPATLVTGYNREDVTMDGIVAYGTGDRLFILNVVGASTPARLVNPHQ